MAIEHERALDVYREYLKNNTRFTFEEIQKQIIKKGGILRVSPGYTLGEFIEDQLQDKVITYNKNDNTYGISHAEKTKRLNDSLHKISEQRINASGPLFTLRPEKKGRKGGMFLD